MSDLWSTHPAPQPPAPPSLEESVPLPCDESVKNGPVRKEGVPKQRMSSQRGLTLLIRCYVLSASPPFFPSWSARRGGGGLREGLERRTSARTGVVGMGDPALRREKRGKGKGRGKLCVDEGKGMLGEMDWGSEKQLNKREKVGVVCCRKEEKGGRRLGRAILREMKERSE